MIEREGDRLVLRGSLTLDNVLAVLDEGEQLFTQPRVLVDLSGVTEADSAAVSLMLEWSRRARSRGTTVAFASPGAAMTSLIELYGLSDLIALSTE